MRRRSTRHRGLSSLVTLALTGVAAASAAVPAHAVAVPCNTAALIAAINNANLNVDTVIDLEPYCLYEVTAPYTAGADDGLPPITNTNGVTINGHHATIKRVSTAPFRLFEVGTSATVLGRLTLNDLTVMNGQPAGPVGGGAVLVNRNSTFAGTNVAFQGGTANIGGGIRFLPGTTGTLTDSRITDNRTTGGASTGGGVYSEDRSPSSRPASRATVRGSAAASDTRRGRSPSPGAPSTTTPPSMPAAASPPTDPAPCT